MQSADISSLSKSVVYSDITTTLHHTLHSSSGMSHYQIKINKKLQNGNH